MKSLWRLMAAFFALSLLAAACGSDDSSDDAADDSSSEESTEAGSEDEAMEDDEAGSDDEAMEDDEAMADSFNVGLSYDIGGRGDQSFNDSAAAGIEAAESEFGITFSEAEPNADGSNRAELLQLQADQSALVIGVGFLFADDVKAVAAENPDVNFAVVDDAMLDFDNGAVPWGDNIAGMTFAEEQGSYLVGVAAALKTETNTVGFIGGVSGFGLIEKFEAGFAAGVASVDPEIEIIAQYITEFPDFDGFNAPDRAQEIATAMYDQDADIIYHAAGGAGAGLFEAAKATSESSGTKVWGIGVDSDQYNTVSPEVQQYVLTSMLKRVDTSVLEIIRTQADGNFVAGNVVYDLSVDGVGYSTSGGFVDDIVDELEAAKADVISGAVVVPTEP